MKDGGDPMKRQKINVSWKMTACEQMREINARKRMLKEIEVKRSGG